MESNINTIATELPEAKHAYQASGVTNEKILWVVLVNFLAAIAISALAPILYLLIIGLVVGIGLMACNVCGIIFIIAPLALAIPWFFGAGIAMAANWANIAMQKKTQNNSKLVHWFFLIFTILGIVIVFFAIATADQGMAATDNLDEIADWLMTALIIYGAIAMIGSILFIGHTEPLPPYCEECEEYMEQINLPAIPVSDARMILSGLEKRQFVPVLKYILGHKPESALTAEERAKKNLAQETFPLQKDLVFRYYYCKSKLNTGVLEVDYMTEEQESKKDKLESNQAIQRIYSTMLNPAEVKGLTPIMQKLVTHLGGNAAKAD